MASAQVERLPAPGEVWANKYRVGRTVGHGAMGRVVAAEHLLLGRPVALKFIVDERPFVSKRFVREAQATQGLVSEHVVRVFDVGVERDVPYLVMELLQGVDLSGWLREQGPLGTTEAVDYLLQACAGVAVAHAAGIVHRDLKPSNLFRVHTPGQAPLIKVLDFGIAKQLDRLERELTSPNALLGSPHFMSPEQLRNARNVDARSDVWSLGVTLYTLLAGKRPFDGETLAEVSIAVATETPATLPTAAPRVPAELDAVVRRALAKHPNDRPQDVLEWATELVPFASDAGKLRVQQLRTRLEHAPGWSSARTPFTDAEPLRSSLPPAERTQTDAQTHAPARVLVPSAPAERQNPRRLTGTLGVAALASALAIALLSLLVPTTKASNGEAAAPRRPSAPTQPEPTTLAATLAPAPSPSHVADASLPSAATRPGTTPKRVRGSSPAPASPAPPKPSAAPPPPVVRSIDADGFAIVE